MPSSKAAKAGSTGRSRSAAAGAEMARHTKGDSTVSPEDKVARLEIEGRIGKDVDPAEVDDLLAVRRSNPDAFARMLARRASRNDALTEQVIPTATQATTRDAAPANPTASLMAAISQLSPKE
jgi:hypothetical protein